MDKLKKIKPIYIEIFSLLLCNLCAINIIIDTLSYTLNQRLIYTIATLVLSLVLFYIRKNKIKYIGTFINLCALGCLCYAIYQYGVALEAMSKNFNIIDFLTGLDSQLVYLTLLLTIYYIAASFVAMIIKKNALYGLINILILLGLQYAYTDYRSTLFFMILIIIILTYYLLTGIHYISYTRYHLIQFICILVIVILMLVPVVLLPYSSYVERPIKELFMSQEAKEFQEDYEIQNGYNIEKSQEIGGSERGENLAGDEGKESDGNNNQENKSGKGKKKGNKGTTSTIKNISLGMSGGGGGADSDLNSAGDTELDNKTVALKVTSSYGPVSTYLRDSSAAYYDHGKWSMLTTKKCQKIYNQPASINLVQSLASQYAQTDVVLTIDEISLSSPYKYYPYYSYDGETFKLDSYSKGQSSSRHTNVKIGVSSSDLLNASGDYTTPQYDQFVEENYLGVSQDIKNQLLNLLNQAGYHEEMTIYEKVTLVKNLLASQCVYTLHPGSCPSDQDPVLYFLLENKKGYCMHFASSAALLLRTINIPARYTTGFVLDESDFKGGNVAAVTQAKAHAWVEVYVKGVGWVMIEATPGSGGASGSDPMDEPAAGKAEETNQQNIEEQKSNSNDQQGLNGSGNQSSQQNSQSSEPNPENKEQKSQGNTQSNSENKQTEKKKTKKNIKKKEVQNQSEDHKVIFIVIIFVLFFVIATIILVLRRKYLLKQREKLLSQENINKKYIAYYDYLNELKQYNSEIENNYRYIALKAAYSNTVILQEELDEIRNYVEECLTLIQENNSSLKLLIYQYIYVLF